MKEIHLKLTDSEYNALKTAVEVQNDIINDITTDIESISSDDIGKTVIHQELYKNIQDEIKDKTEQLAAIRTLALKLGMKLNDQGYTTI